MICDGIIEAVGRTPLVQLRRIFRQARFHLFAKLESTNPGGSSKDRSAVEMVKQAIEGGKIFPGTTVIESSSGNMAIALAQVCAYYQLRLICVVDSKTTPQNLSMLAAYGARVEVVTEPDPRTGELLVARLNRVNELLQSIESSFWPNQYTNTNNALAQSRTMEEIHHALGDGIDYLFCATSTCGTIRGCSDYLQRNGLRTEVVAVDALGSVIFGSQPRKRLIPGHGASIRPALSEGARISRVIHISDLDCVVGCRRLVTTEGILAGGSSGGVVSAVDQAMDSIPRDAVCVAILPDRGERYLDTIYSEKWVIEHFGDISHLWKDSTNDQLRKSSSAHG